MLLQARHISNSSSKLPLHSSTKAVIILFPNLNFSLQMAVQSFTIWCQIATLNFITNIV